MIKFDKKISKYYLVLVTLLIFGCQTENKSTDVYSYQIGDKTEKNETLVSQIKINHNEYIELLKNISKKNYKPQKISDLDSIKRILKNRVVWGDNENDDFIKSIVTEKGQKLILNDKSNDCGFSEGWSGYYPEYDILVLEGGHSSDMCFSIKTGETDLTIGNPEYIIPSPKNTYRLNGSFGGQECISYFFQKKDNEKFIYLTEFGWDYDICEFEEFYWINENEFIYIKKYHEEGYFRGKIKNNT